MQDIKQWIVVAGAGLGAACLVSCASMSSSSGNITKASFGKIPDGTPVDIYTLRNANGVEARICTYGGIVVSLKTPDRNGKLGDVVLGYDNLDGYVKNNPFFGCFVGRYGNRIAGGKFTLDGKTYTLATNNGPNHLHGGIKGFDKAVWKAQLVSGPHGGALEMRYTSKDGEEGYPGNLSVTALYTLTDDNGLRLDYTATTDKPTVVNLTQHSYYNLAGGSDILGHEVMIVADKFTPVDATLIPTGELRQVKGTPLDFTTPTKIGARINTPDEQLKLGNGYDHNFVLNKSAGKLGLAARVYEPTSGRVMEVLTTEPGMQLYSGNFLDGSITGKGGWVYKQRSAFCMEPQHFPDSPNKPGFPSTVLRPGETYKNTIVYRFSAK
jgi:aldose 1-epimerase